MPVTTMYVAYRKKFHKTKDMTDKNEKQLEKGK